jgi:cytochrome c oxidase subunit 1
MRCKGMTMGRLPLLPWLYLVVSFMVFVAVSPLTAAQIMLTIDRYLGAHFFDTQAGGSAILWMHFFWIFGHPEVYILVLPAFAFANEIIPVFSRKAIFGYPAMVAATVAIGFISLSVWAHHMFTVGLGAEGNIFFTVATMIISVPTGIKIFNWMATMWGGKIIFKSPMLFCTAFLFQFMIAGLTGIMLSAAPFDWQLGNSYFVVAHFHYVLVGAILIALFRGFLLLVPEDHGRIMSETLAKWHFWLFVIGFHLTFDFMHVPGLLGMPRRIYTYEPGRGWDGWNLIVSVGGSHSVHRDIDLRRQHGLVVLSRQGRRARSVGRLDAGVVDDFAAAGLQLRREPSVSSRRPLWDLKASRRPGYRL